MAARVSVIVPFLDEERFLGEAVESVLAQSYDDWELLLVDDGSSDGSTTLALEYARRFPGRIAALHHPDGRTRGQSAARNLALSQAAGEYVAFLDADDVWLPDKLLDQTAILDREQEAGMLYGRSEWWFGWQHGTAAPSDFTHELGVPSGTLLRPPSLIEPFFASQTAALPNTTSTLLRRAVAHEVGGFEESFRNPYEDQAFYAKVCMHTPVIAADRVWDRYRQHPDSVTARMEADDSAAEIRHQFLTWLIDYLRRSRFSDADVYAALRRQRFLCAHPRLRRGLGRLRRRGTA